MSAAMEINPIVTKADHRAALKQIEALMSARPGTPDGGCGESDRGAGGAWKVSDDRFGAVGV